jgi:hypothetical protein
MWPMLSLAVPLRNNARLRALVTPAAAKQVASSATREPGTAHLKRAQEPALPLHKAAAAGNAPLVSQLLDSGSDPTLVDGGGKTAYEVAANKDVRDAMRRFMAAQPGRWDYAAARIPSALSPDLEDAQVCVHAQKHQDVRPCLCKRTKGRCQQCRLRD